jgi:hypothetical protein
MEETPYSATEVIACCFKYFKTFHETEVENKDFQILNIKLWGSKYISILVT